MEFAVVQGDIAARSADALANAAGTSLRMGSGVAGALLRGANGPIEAEARAKGPVEPGEVVVTDAYDLDADYVLHAAAVSHGGVREVATAESVSRATENALATADALGCESLVLPALGCGNGGFYLREGAGIICSVIAEHDPTSLEAVSVIGYTDREARAIASTAEAVDASVEAAFEGT